LARHRSTREPLLALDGLTAFSNRKQTPGNKSRHRPARQMHRHPLAAVAATVVAAGMFAGSQPVSISASADASRSATESNASSVQRAADANAATSRSDRTPGAPAEVPPPTVPGADVALVPDLSAAGSAGGPNGTAALTGNPCPTEGFGGVKPHVAEAGYHLMIVFGLSESDIGGVASRPGNPSSDHPKGLALDFMVDTSTGDALAAYADENSAELGINYILWQVADHYDHVHISFNSEPGTGVTC